MKTKTKLYLVGALTAPFALPGALLLACLFVLLAPVALCAVALVAAVQFCPSHDKVSAFDACFVDDPKGGAR